MTNVYLSKQLQKNWAATKETIEIFDGSFPKEEEVRWDTGKKNNAETFDACCRNEKCAKIHPYTKFLVGWEETSQSLKDL